MKEVWENIKGYHGYQASNLGRVKKGDCFIPKKNPNKQENLNYKTISLRNENGTKIKLLHRLVLETFIGDCPKGMVGCHNDGNPTNNSLDNLRWDTQKNNCFDRIKHGTLNYSFGSKNGKAKLIEKEVSEIKHRLSLGDNPKTIAKDYNVKVWAIRRIGNNITWKKVK